MECVWVEIFELVRLATQSVLLLHAGKQIVDRSYSEMKDTIAAGIVDENKAVGE